MNNSKKIGKTYRCSGSVKVQWKVRLLRRILSESIREVVRFP
jgi:hypothetical protein